MRKHSLKKKDIKNIFKLIGICLVSVIAVLLLRKWYLNRTDYHNNIPVLDSVVTHQIKANEFDNYVIDNDTAIIYMCVSNEELCRSLEEDFKDYIVANSLEDIIVYLDLSSTNNISKFYSDLNKKYKYKTEIKEYPTVLYFENGAIKDSVSGEDLTASDIEKFLKDIQVVL